MQRGGNSRAPRGQTPNRSRANHRGRGSTSRGGSNSSGKSSSTLQSNIPTGPRAIHGAPARSRGNNSRGKSPKPILKNHYSSSKHSGTSPTENSSSDSFESERVKNAAKREHLKGQTSATVTGRGGRGPSRGTFNNKQVRFADPLAVAEDPPSKSTSPAPSNPFVKAATPSALGIPAAMSASPFAAANTEASKNPFSKPNSPANPFGAPSQPSATSAAFGKPSGPPAATLALESAHKAAANPFGAPSNPFASTPQTNGIFNPVSVPQPFLSPPATNPFGAPSGIHRSGFSTISAASAASPALQFGSPVQSSTTAISKPSSNPFSNNAFGAPSGAKTSLFSTISSTSSASTSGSPFSDAAAASKAVSSLQNVNPFGAHSQGQLSNSASSSPGKSSNAPLKSSLIASSLTNQGSKSSTIGFSSTSKSVTRSKSMPTSLPTPAVTNNALANRMDELLKKQGIIPPPWPTSTPGDPRQKDAVEAFWQILKGYRTKVRAALIRVGLLDDPDKPKKLSEAIDFKGTCEDMCPEFEKITRIVERDVQGAEKELAPDGNLWPVPHRMVKAFSRGAAGQDAPLPMDVRSPAALRRTLDYLFHTVLGEDGDLSTVHGFLWDRTRAIRRDFVFQSSMSPLEMADQVYCLERITRFHAIALHQMSREEIVAEDFSEQQEVEQLGKALLSLIHAYEDCQAQGISCENEAEFRAYYILFNSHNTGILETVQDWGWKFWGESELIRIAVNLVETLQNIWDLRGPLKPHSATDIAQNGYSRFFTIVGDKKVSYTMACFAEIHFNSVRKAALKTILASYRKQRDQTKDWTLTQLNKYLQFDNKQDVIAFGEKYGLHFEEIDGETYLSFESQGISDPFPPLRQRHSYSLVERKRGNHSLPAVIDTTVYDEDEAEEESSEEESLFVEDAVAKVKDKNSPVFPLPTNTMSEAGVENVLQYSASTQAFQNQPPSSIQTAPSLFNRAAAPQTFGSNFVTPKPAETSLSTPPETTQNASSVFSKPSAQEAFSIFSKSSIQEAQAPTLEAQTKQPPSFSFLNQPLVNPVLGTTTPPESLEQHTVTAGPPWTEAPRSIFRPSINAEPSAEGPNTPFPFGKNSSTATSSIQSPNSQSSLGGLSVSLPQNLTLEFFPDSSILASTSNTPGPSLTPKVTFGTGSTSSTLQNSILSVAPQGPLSQSKPIPPPAFQDKSAEGLSSSTSTRPPATYQRNPKFENFIQWFTVGDGGIIDQFVECYVTQILRNTVRIYQKETEDRLAKEEEEKVRANADQFRYRSLATKYGHRWREAAHRMWLRRKGREARQARQEMAQSLRASKASQSANLIQDFRASTSSSRRGSLESLLDSTGVSDGAHDSNSEARALFQGEEGKAITKQRRPTENSPSSTNGHNRGKYGNPLRRSLLSDPTYLQGGSRIHLMSKYDLGDETRRQVSGVQTDYFRLKARGISTLPDGTPLANSVAKDTLHHKRRFDGTINSDMSKRSPMPPAPPRSVPGNFVAQSVGSWNEPGGSEVIQAMKARARDVMGEDQEFHLKKRGFDNDDDELFARAKRVREQMDEGEKWYHKEIERQSASRSIS